MEQFPWGKKRKTTQPANKKKLTSKQVGKNPTVGRELKSFSEEQRV